MLMPSMEPPPWRRWPAQKPDVIVHEMTALDAANDLRRVDQSFAVTNRLRTEGVNNLLAAARHGSQHMRHGAKALLRFSRNAHDADRQ